MKLLHKKKIFLCALLSLLGSQANGETSISSSMLVNADPNSRPDSNSAELLIETDAKQNQQVKAKAQEQQSSQTNFQVVHSLNPSSKEQESPLSATKFDPSNFKSIYAAIRNHPNLRTVSIFVGRSDRTKRM